MPQDLDGRDELVKIYVQDPAVLAGHASVSQGTPGGNRPTGRTTPPVRPPAVPSRGYVMDISGSVRPSGGRPHVAASHHASLLDGSGCGSRRRVHDTRR